MLFGLGNKRIVERDFSECELFSQVGEFKIYYPTTEEKATKFEEIMSKYSDNQEDNLKNVYALLELLTNMNIEECLIKKQNSRIESRVDDVLDEVMLLQEEMTQKLERKLRVAQIKSKYTKQEVDNVKKNRNDKEVILERMKENEIKRKEEQAEEIVQAGIEKDTIEVVEEKEEDKNDNVVDLTKMTLEELEEYKKQLLIKQINEIQGE